MKRLVIIEDQTAIREMLVEILRLDANYQLVGEAGDGQTAVQLCLETNPMSACSSQAPRPERGGYPAPHQQKTPPDAGAGLLGHENPVLVARCWRPARMASSRRPPALFEFKKGLETVANGGTYFGPAVAALLRNVVANPATSSAPDFLTIASARSCNLWPRATARRKSPPSSASA